MDRADALIYLKPRFDPMMLGASRGVADDIDGYGPSIDMSFLHYSNLNGITPNVMTSIIPAEDAYGFSVLLTATTYDLLLPFYALQPDFSVDAPLTNVKFSQTYRALKELRDQAWAEASEYGYIVAPLNAGGFVLDLHHNEPSDALSGWREFG